MNKAREILRLKELDLSGRAISKALGISRPTVTKVLTCAEEKGLVFSQACKMSDSDLSGLLYPGNKKRDQAESLKELFPRMVRELKKTGVTKQLLWQEYLKQNPGGIGYSRFCYHFKEWEQSTELSMRMEHKPGDKMYIDYAGKKFRITDRKTGKTREVETFVAVLGHSQLTYVEVRESQKQEDFITSVENSLWYFGGVPKAVVPDNLKAAVKKAHKYEPELNPGFADFGRYYNTAIIPARAYKPKDKSLVEKAVSIIYTRIYAPLRDRVFTSLDELNEAIGGLLEEHNSKKLTKMTVSRRDLFEEGEKQALGPLPEDKYPRKTFITRKAAFNYHVEIPEDKHYYSVPYIYRGKYLQIAYDQRMVAIYFENSRIALHQRDRTAHGYSTIKQHMPKQHKFMKDWTPGRFKQWATSIGPDTVVVINHLLTSRPHPEQAYKVCLGILNLAQKHAREQVNAACRKARDLNRISLRQIMKNIEAMESSKYYAQELFDELPLPQAHENIRGNNYR